MYKVDAHFAFWKDTGLTRAPQTAVAVALFAWWPACFAAAPVYFDLGGLMLLVLGVVFGLFLLIGRGKGLIAFIVLFGTFLFWAQFNDWLRVARASTAREVLSQICLRDAGVTGSPLSYKPERIYVQIDERLRPSAQNRLWLSVSPPREAPGIEYIDTIPLKLDPASGYVQIAVLQEKIDGAKGWFVDGVQTTVKDGAGAIRAKHIDYKRDYGWCLGGSPPWSIERFLQSHVSIPVRLTTSVPHSTDQLPILSPAGTMTAVERGHFSASTRAQFAGEEGVMKAKLALLPDSADCHYQKGVGSEYFAICRQGTSEENKIDLARLSAIHKFGTTWVGFFNDHSDAMFFDSFSVVERSAEGAIVGRWYVRLPPIESRENGTFELRNIVFSGRRFTANLVFGRKIESADSKSYKEWYEYQTTVSAELIAK